jgi:hypothetical protein
MSWTDQIQPILVSAAALIAAATVLVRLLPHPEKRNAAHHPPDREVPTMEHITLQHWLFLRLGREVGPLVDGAHQCVALVNDYLEVVHGLPATTVPTAADLFGITIPGFSLVVNNAVNQPPPGSIVIWHEDPRVMTGPAGHAAIAVLPGQFYIISCDQNWSGHQLAEVVGHDYRGVVGWHSPTP